MSQSTQVLNTDCCGDVSENPKQRMRRRKPHKGLSLYQIDNPIPSEIEDPEELRRLFQKWNLVPYSGSTKESGQMLLTWYQMLAQLSPTNNACISKKLKYAVGGKATFVQMLDPEFDTGEEARVLSTAEKKTVRDTINEFFEFEHGYAKLHRFIGKSFEATGNAWCEMSFSKTLDVGRIHIKAHKVTNCLYVNTKAGEAKVVAVSPKWTNNYLDKYPPRYVPMYPNFVEENGAMRTMFHLKNGDNTWYGRPESEGADVYKYREVQDALYLVKQAGANFTGQLIIEVEDDDPEFAPAIDEQGAGDAGFNSFADRFEQSYTQKSEDPQSVLITARPYGSKPMFVFQMKPHTSESWYKVTGEIAEQKIIRAHGLTLRFMGLDVANGFATDAFVSDYVMNVEPIIEELMQTLTGFTNKIMTAGWKLLGKEDMNAYSIVFNSPIQSAIDQYKSASAAPQQTQTPQPQML